MAESIHSLRDEVRVTGCNTQDLVRVAEQFAELELEIARQTEITAAKIAAEKADWNKVGVALGKTYQFLVDEAYTNAAEALREIEKLLNKRGILVPLPVVKQEGAGHVE